MPALPSFPSYRAGDTARDGGTSRWQLG